MTLTTPSPIPNQAAGGWKLVPIAPTPDMAKAGMDQWYKTFTQHDLYVAMVNAAPTAPTTGSAPVAEGWQLTETKNLDALIIAMERAENKGYLPDSIKEAWGEFMCNPARVAAPASPAASVPTEVVAKLCADHLGCPLNPNISAFSALLAASIGGDKS